jgi:hypothetical protein
MPPTPITTSAKIRGHTQCIYMRATEKVHPFCFFSDGLLAAGLRKTFAFLRGGALDAVPDAVLDAMLDAVPDAVPDVVDDVVLNAEVAAVPSAVFATACAVIFAVAFA